jgi:hypothetical protein
MSGELGKALRKGITAEMPRAQLEQHIISLLKTQTMSTLSTCRDNVPRGTPLEYFVDGLTLWCVPDAGVKVENLKVNPRISLSVYNVTHPDWDKCWEQYWGIQLTGKGELFKAGSPEYEKGLSVIHFEDFMTALGQPAGKRPAIKLVLRITPTEIILKHAALIARGYARKQTWHSS